MDPLNILENYDSETDNYKYKVTYRFTDRAGLSDEVSRISEFTNDPNAPASVSYTGADYTEGGIHYLEADSSSNNQFFPVVNAKTSVSSGDIYAAVASEVLLLYSESDPQPLPSYYDEDGNYFLPNVVNYFEDGSASYFLPNGSLDGTEIQKDSKVSQNLLSDLSQLTNSGMRLNLMISNSHSGYHCPHL